MPRRGIQEDENSPGRHRDTHACRGYFQSSSSFLPGKTNRHRAKKLGRGALDYLQSHPFCKKETLGTDQGFGVSLEHEDGDTRGGRGRCWEMSAYTSAARHAAKCAESGRTRNVA